MFKYNGVYYILENVRELKYYCKCDDWDNVSLMAKTLKRM